MRPTEGFTIIEVLIAVTLLSVIVLVVMASLTGSFRLSGNTTLQSSATNTAQAAMEAVRGQWQQNNAYYNAACVEYTLPANTSVSVQDETIDGVAVGAAYAPKFQSSCTGATPRTYLASLRRITVATTNTLGANTGRSILTVEMAP